VYFLLVAMDSILDLGDDLLCHILSLITHPMDFESLIATCKLMRALSKHCFKQFVDEPTDCIIDYIDISGEREAISTETGQMWNNLYRHGICIVDIITRSEDIKSYKFRFQEKWIYGKLVSLINLDTNFVILEYSGGKYHIRKNMYNRLTVREFNHYVKYEDVHLGIFVDVEDKIEFNAENLDYDADSIIYSYDSNGSITFKQIWQNGCSNVRLYSNKKLTYMCAMNNKYNKKLTCRWYPNGRLQYYERYNKIYHITESYTETGKLISSHVEYKGVVIKKIGPVIE
jgi:hypothetical protein